MARPGSSARVRRGVLVGLVGAVAAAGLGLWIVGALAAREATDRAIADVVATTSSSSTTTSTTAPAAAMDLLWSSRLAQLGTPVLVY